MNIVKRYFRSDIIIFSIFLAVLIYLSGHNFLLFHAVGELFSISIAFVMFVIAWHTRKYMQNSYLVLLGIAYLFIGLLDLMHTLSYKGMNIFTDYDYYANQLWVVARLMEAGSLLGGFFLFRYRKALNHTLIFAAYTLVTAAALLSVYIWKIFPVCFIKGVGQTPFKFWAEIFIISVLLCALLFLYRNRRCFNTAIFKMMGASIVLTILSELGFTFYISNYGFSNIAGHFFKIISFYLIYRSIIQTGLDDPFQLIFNELNEANQVKDRFFSIISHDLRSPMSGLVETLRLLEEEPGLEEPEKEELLQLSVETSNHILRELDNLQNWAKLQTDRFDMKFEKISINSVFQNIISLYQPILKQKQLTLQLHSQNHDCHISYDRVALETIIRNLINNAVKFSHRHSRIDCFINCDVGQQVTVSIKDYGTGMSAEQIKHLQTTDHPLSRKGTENESGTGLGLYLVKNFVKSGNGRLEINSTPGEGSSFTVILPDKPDNY